MGMTGARTKFLLPPLSFVFPLMWFTRLAISRPIMIWMCLLAIAILGTQAYFRLPAELNPRTEIPIIHVTTIAPGYAPPEVETQVTRQIEEAVGTVGGILDVSSSSQANVSVVVADFKFGTNLDRALAEMRGRIEAIRSTLPADVRPPVLAKLDINALPVLYLGFSSTEINLAQLRDYAENTLRPRLERVSGVATVQVLGGEQREIKVSVDGTRLRQFGITIADVVNSLKAGGRDIPGGSVRTGESETDVRLSGAYSSLNSIRSAPILSERLAQSQAQARMMAAQRGQPETLSAPPLTVADVAEVTDGNAERDTLSRVNGADGIGVVITQESDANTVRVVDGVNLALDELKPTLPPGLQKIVLRDDAVTVRGALEDVNVTLILGALLAMGVILLFLHNLRGTLIVMLAIPACMVATFLVLSLAGFSLNQMTLLALSLSVGILVDDSIVVLESITRHLKMGKTPEQAAIDGRSEIGFADVTTTLVDVVVFVPIGFMGGIVGSFFKQFGLTIATATLFSLIVSFSITPMLAARWYKQGEDLTPRRGLYFALEKLYHRLEGVYRRVITFALRRRALVLITAIAALVVIFWVSFQRLGFEFLPGTDQGQIAVSIELPPGSSLAATEAVADRAEKLIRDTPDVAATFSNVGQVLGGFGYIPQQGGQFAQINVRLIPRQTVTNKNPKFRKRSDEAITTELRGKLDALARETHARISANALQNVQGVSAEVQIMLQASDLDKLNTFANQVKDRIAQVPGVRDPDVSVRTGKPEVRASVDPQKAAQYSVASSLVGSVIRDSLVGNTDTVFQENGKAFPVRVQIEPLQRSNIAEVENLPVGTDAQGQSVLLADVAAVTRTTGTTNIDRRNAKRLITVTASLAPGFALGTVQGQIDKIIAQIPHDDIKIEWGGEAKTIGENSFYFASALILAVLLVYIVMASLFNNLGTPFVIMFTLPMALIGALGALVLTGETMSLVAAIGIIMLVGLMGRNAILLLDYTNTLRSRGEARTEAIIDAGATRLRPILMTTTATIIGMLPVALRFGEASETRAPMAIVVIGGLIISSVLTLIVIPVLYSIFDDLFGKGKK